MKLVIYSVFLSVYLAQSAERPPPPMEKEVLYGSWAGFENSGPDFYTLLLREKSSYLTIVHPSGINEVYKIAWTWNDEILFISAVPLKSAEAITLTVEGVDYTRISIILRGVNYKWERKATVYNEKQFFNKIKRGKSEIENID